MYDVTVAQFEEECKAERAEREAMVAALCWEDCPECRGNGHTVERWPDDDNGGPDFILRPTCPGCDGSGVVQLQDPYLMTWLFDVTEEDDYD